MKSATEKDQSAEEFFYNRGFKPCFHDGRLSSHTYLVVACKEARAYNCIGIRDLGDDEYRVHAYPSFEFFGINAAEDLGVTCYGPRNDRNGVEYEGTYLNAEQVTTLLTKLQADDLCKVAPLDQVFPVLESGYDAATTDSAHDAS